MYRTNYENYLMHYGVKGMKWGVRHQPVRVGRRGTPIGGNASNSRRKANAKKWLKRGAIIAGAGLAAYGAYYLYKSGNADKLISLGKGSFQSASVPRIDIPRTKVNRADVSRTKLETFKPETFTPETFKPETFTPETFKPETFTPETFKPKSNVKLNARKINTDQLKNKTLNVKKPPSNNTGYSQSFKIDVTDQERKRLIDKIGKEAYERNPVKSASITKTINKHKDTKISKTGDTSKWENLIKQNSDLLNKTLDDLLKN